LWQFFTVFAVGIMVFPLGLNEPEIGLKAPKILKYWYKLCLVVVLLGVTWNIRISPWFGRL